MTMEHKDYVVSAYNMERECDEILPYSFSRKEAIEFAKRLRSTGAANVRIINYVKRAIISE